MIICSCNFLTDREVRTMVTTAVRPPTTPGQVYKCLGCRPKCGRCARSISLIMGEALGCSRTGLVKKLALHLPKCAIKWRRYRRLAVLPLRSRARAPVELR